MSIWEKMGFGGYKGFSHEADRLLRSAVELAGNLGCEKADTSHLLLAILQQDQGAAARFLAGKQICEPEVRRQLAQTRRAPALHGSGERSAPRLCIWTAMTLHRISGVPWIMPSSGRRTLT